MNLIELVTTTAPSDMFFAIGEQINALMGLILCLMAMWNRMENPKLTGGIILAAGTIWFILSGFICGMFRIPTLWTVFPTGIVAVLVFSKVTNLTVSKVMLLCSTAAYVVAIIYYLSLLMDVAVLGEQSVNLRVGWPGFINQLILDILAPLRLMASIARLHPIHAQQSRHQFVFLAAHLAVPVHFNGNRGLVPARR